MGENVKGSLLIPGSPEPELDMPEGYERIEVRPKLYVNGFPKSGLHLAVLFARTLVEGPAHKSPWAGSFADNAWSNEWIQDWRIYQGVSRLRENTFLKGHTGYREDIADFLYRFGVQMAFVYRDLRDVVVSQSFHVLSDDDQNATHPDKELYRALPDHEAVILACIRGIDKYPGIVDRWEKYAGWLDVEWVHQLRYERMRLEPYTTGKEYTEYVYKRMAAVNGIEIELDEQAMRLQACKMVIAAEQRHMSPTYRRGIPGGWREWWTDEIDQAFADVGGHEWNERLGYE